MSALTETAPRGLLAPWPSALQTGPCEACGRPGRRLVRVILPPGPAPSYTVCDDCAADAVEHVPTAHPDCLLGAAEWVPGPPERVYPPGLGVPLPSVYLGPGPR